MDAAELRKIIKIAKKEGLKSLKFGDISLEFNQEQIPNPATTPAAQSLSVLGEDDIPMPDESALLYASTPYYDELLNQREGAKAAPKEN